MSQRSGSVPPLSIPAARTFRLIPAKAYDGKITQAIPPPPPYHASVRNAIHRNEINQITQIQQSCSTNVFSSSVTTNINAINASSSAVYMDQNAIKDSIDTNTETGVDEATESEPLQMGEIITADDFDMQNEVNGQHELNSSADAIGIDNGKSHGRCGTASVPLKQKTKNRTNGDVVADTAAKVAPSTSGKELRNSVKQEVSEAAPIETESISEKRAGGLKVLSNVQVSPNAILNVSMNTKANEASSLNNMIIVSSLPSTSTGTTTSQQQQQAILPQLTKPQSLLKNLNDSRTSSDMRNSKNTKGNGEVSIMNYHFHFLS